MPLLKYTGWLAHPHFRASLLLHPMMGQYLSILTNSSTEASSKQWPHSDTHGTRMVSCVRGHREPILDFSTTFSCGACLSKTRSIRAFMDLGLLILCGAVARHWCIQILSTSDSDGLEPCLNNWGIMFSRIRALSFSASSMLGAGRKYFYL